MGAAREIGESRSRRAASMIVVVVIAATVILGAPAWWNDSRVATDRPSLGFVRVAPAEPDPRPNIVLIMTDDQRQADLDWMPRTRALLGGQGVTFRSGLSPDPLCCPARATVLTGQYGHNNGVLSNYGINGGYSALRDPDNTVATWLKDAGYRTGFVGKFLNGYHRPTSGRPQGWNWWDPTIRGIYDFETFTQANNGRPTAYRNSYITDVVADRTAGLIQRWSREDQPFFIWASYVAPHGSSRPDGAPVPAERHAGTARGVAGAGPPPASLLETDLSDKPALLRGLPPADPAEIRMVTQRRIESLRSVDEAVADTVRALAAAGELENTLIIFTSDNGFMLGEHNHWGKTLAYEESVLVPFLVRGPGVAAGDVSPRAATTADIAPTILAAAGVTPRRKMDGRSLLDASATDPVDDGRAVLLQAGYPERVSEVQPLWWYRGLRTARYTYVRWYDGFEELYDRRADPHQLDNAAGLPAYRGVLAAMRRELSAAGQCSGPEACYPEVRLPKIGVPASTGSPPASVGSGGEDRLDGTERPDLGTDPGAGRR